jgi:ubiquinone/menaquinone biosynthesis C-methylase UbiE
MSRYPKTNREEFTSRSKYLTEQEIKISKEFGKEYFDGDRKFGLGGYYYDPKFFTNVVEDFIKYYQISENDKILDVGCGKGFMLFDFIRLLPNISIAGIDISKYCYDNAISIVKPFITIGSCDELPYEDNSFDFVFSIATIHNLEINGIRKSLQEIMRVTRKGAFIKVNAYSNQSELDRIKGWNIVASDPLSCDQWFTLFHETGFKYDYDFFVP